MRVVDLTCFFLTEFLDALQNLAKKSNFQNYPYEMKILPKLKKKTYESSKINFTFNFETRNVANGLPWFTLGTYPFFEGSYSISSGVRK